MTGGVVEGDSTAAGVVSMGVVVDDDVSVVVVGAGVSLGAAGVPPVGSVAGVIGVEDVLAGAGAVAFVGRAVVSVVTSVT